MKKAVDELMKLHIVNTFRDGILIYNISNKLIFRTHQNNYVDFENANLYQPEQFSSDTAQEMCRVAKKIVAKTKFHKLLDFLDSLEFPVRTNQQNVSIDVFL